MPRENVKSLIISNCGPTATLLFNDDSSKSFTFKTMESCFGFVQEHYKTMTVHGFWVNAVSEKAWFNNKCLWERKKLFD